MTNLEKLPELCWIKISSTNELAIVKRGVRGYFPQSKENKIYSSGDLDRLNKELGVTKAQMEAMRVGSMWGWDAKGADPDNYSEDGMFIK